MKDMERTRACVAVLGYDRTAREHVLGLRGMGGSVAVGLRLGAFGWTRALEDGLLPTEVADAVDGAAVVAILVQDEEQASVWRAIEPRLARGALVVLGRSLPLASGTIDLRGHDVVLVASSEERVARIAVHRDATGRASDRADAYARAVFGSRASIVRTTVAAQIEAELADLEEVAGGTEALLASIEAAIARIRVTHTPDAAALAFYEGLRDRVGCRASPAHSVVMPAARELTATRGAA